MECLDLGDLLLVLGNNLCCCSYCSLSLVGMGLVVRVSLLGVVVDLLMVQAVALAGALVRAFAVVMGLLMYCTWLSES